MEAIILAGGKAERLGAAAQGRPKALVPIGGRPLISFQIAALQRAGVERVIVSCAKDQGSHFAEALDGTGMELITASEPQPLGRGGGIRYAAGFRKEAGSVYVMNGDDLLDVDLAELLQTHRTSGAAATLVVAPLISAFGIVEIDDDDRITGFAEAPRLPHWVNAGLYVMEQEALELLPEKGDHEDTTFPELARAGRLRAFRHEGTWLTVNTPKELRKANEFVEANPGWPA